MSIFANCPHDEEDITRDDPVRGTYCRCGAIFSTDNYKNDVQFDGNLRMMGKIVNTKQQIKVDPRRPGKMISAGISGSQLRENRYEKAISKIASTLNIGPALRKRALNYYVVASTKKYKKKNEGLTSLTQGRDTDIVAAACLYMACRIERKPHLLIDFADAAQKDLFKIAEVFNLFRNNVELEGEMPIIDPSLFIDRFCGKLEFGDKLSQVKDTAIRLIQSMNRSWMTTGRRPNGLCGAAILISAKIHGFRRTPNEIVDVVHVGPQTIRNHVVEFKDLNVAQLNRGELRAIEEIDKDPYNFNYEDFNPPAYIMNQKMLKMEPEQQEEIHSIINSKKEKIELYLQMKQQQKSDNQDFDAEYLHQQSKHQSVDQEQLFKNDKIQAIQVYDWADKINIYDTGEVGPLMTMDSRQDMTIDTLTYNTKGNTVIPIDDIPNESIMHYIHSEEERSFKEILWKSQNKEYLREQKKKKKLKLEEEQKKRNKNKNKSTFSQISQVSHSGKPDSVSSNPDHSDSEDVQQKSRKDLQKNDQYSGKKMLGKRNMKSKQMPIGHKHIKPYENEKDKQKIGTSLLKNIF